MNFKHFLTKVITLLAFFSLLLSTIPLSTYAAITKTGTVLSTGSTSEVTYGDQIDWTIEYNNDTNTALNNISIFDEIQNGQTFIPGSLEYPNNWDVYYSTNNGVNYSLSEPLSGLTNFEVRSNNLLPDDSTSSNISNIIIPQQLGSPINTAANGGDGYTPIVYGNNIYTVYHHWPEPNGSSNPTINCFSFAAVQCPGYPKSVFPAGVTDFHTNNQPGNIIKGSKMFIPTHTSSQGSGLSCFDFNTASNCGYYQLNNLNATGSGAFSVGHGSTHLGATMFDDKVYVYSQDYTVGCFDLSTYNPCVGQPYTLDTFGVSAPSNVGNWEIASDYRQIGSKTFLMYSRWGGSGFNQATLLCFDAATNSSCAGFVNSNVELVGQATGTALYHLIDKQDTSGNPNGFCNVASIPLCWDLNGASTAVPAGFLITGTGNFQSFHGNAITVDSKVFMAGGYNTNYVNCWDWSTNAGCAGFGSGGVLNLTGGFFSPYDLNYVNGCLLLNGHSGIVISLNPLNGVSPCTTFSGQTSFEIDSSSMYCSGGVSTFAWDKIKVINTTIPSTLTTLTASVYDSNNILLTSGSLLTTGQLDISSIPYIPANENLNVIIDTAGTSLSEPLQIATYYVGDPFEVCYSTTVNQNGVFPTGKVTNTATLVEDGSTTVVSAELDLLPIINGQVYLDPDQSGIQEITEPNGSIPAGTTVTITDVNNPLNTYTAVLNPDGTYSQVVTAGQYTVTVVPAPGYAISTSLELGDGTGANPTIVTVANGETKSVGKDGLYLAPGRIGDTVFYDENGNGIQDIGEDGIENVTVTLLYANDDPVDCNLLTPAIEPCVVQTDANGNYIFEDLLFNDYKVVVTNPSGFYPSSDLDGVLDNQTLVTLSSTGVLEELDADFGFTKPTSVGDYTWEDTNGNGIQDSGEPLLQGVSVSITDTLGNPILDIDGDPVANVLTDSNGEYSFTNLIPGEYIITFNISGYTPTLSLSGTDTVIDSNINQISGSTNVNLIAEVYNDSVDAGFVVPVTLGNFVFQDLNGNGIQESGENGIEGITVTLLDENGNPILDASQNPVSSINTNALGAYSFTNLIPGNYQIVLSNTGAYKATLQSIGDQATDSDINTGFESVIVSLSSGVNNNDLDAGLILTASIGDRVWDDLNANGIQDVGENGIEGAVVRLVDTNGDPVLNADGNPVANISTDVNGNYLFSNLIPGAYFVVFEKPTGYEPTTPNQGGNNTLDSDGQFFNYSNTTMQSNPVIVTSNQVNSNIDMGFFIPASVGNLVWNDLNANGIQDIGENGVSSGTIRIFDENGVQITQDIYGNNISTITPDSNGQYIIENLLPGSYQVQYTNDVGYIDTLQLVGNINSDSSLQTNGFTSIFELVSGDYNQSFDFGVYQPASVSNQVFEDMNANGVQDVGENGIPGVVVSIVDENGDPVLDVNGNVVSSVTTTVDGLYEFSNLIPGQYQITFQAPSTDYITTLQNQGNDNQDSDINSTGATAIFTLSSGQNDDSVDAGFYQYAQIGNYVWEDVNGNGVQESGEPALANVTVNLLDNNGAIVSTTQTDSNGVYSFDSVIPGVYSVQVISTLKATVPLTTDLNQNSDIQPTTLTTNQLTIVSNQVRDDLDAGLVTPVEIGSLVWYDTDQDGIKDLSEDPIEGVTVSLVDQNGNPVVDADGNPVNPIVTDENGEYVFTNLLPGQYQVVFTRLNGLAPSPNVSGDDVNNSDGVFIGNSMTGTTPIITLLSGEDNLIQNQGFFNPGSIGNYVWNDENGNGIQDMGEPALQGVTLNLLDENGDLVTTDAFGNIILPQVTDINGLYTFNNLLSGNYQVQIVLNTDFKLTTQNVLTNDAIDSDFNITTLLSDVVSISSGTVNDTIDAGLIVPVGIGNLVWEDVNGNGVQDIGENGIAGVTIELVNTDGDPVYDADGNIINPTITDENGFYSFTNLIPGSYQIKVTPPSDYQETIPFQAENISIDSSVSTSGLSNVITLSSGDFDQTIDIGLVATITIGDIVWDDSNADGIQQLGENGIEGVTVTLLDENGDTVLDIEGNEVEPVLTSASGMYQFTNLLPGTYTVQFTKPEGFYNSPSLQGNTNTDSNGIPSLVNNYSTTEVFTVISGETNNSIDQGYWSPASIGGTIWDDLDGDGSQDLNEDPFTNVSISIIDKNGDPVLDADGNPVNPIVTDENGEYVFTNLVPGDYTILINPVPGTVSTVNGSLTSGLENKSIFTTPCSDYPTSTSPIPCRINTSAVSGIVDMKNDGGFIYPSTIGDYIWEDKNGDGIQNNDENGVNGIELQITDIDGNPVLDVNDTPIPNITTVNKDGKDGFYEFIGLKPGEYIITIVGGIDTFIPTNIFLGGDEQLDSNLSINYTMRTLVTSGDKITSLDGGLYQSYEISIEDPYVCGSGFYGITTTPNSYEPTVYIKLYDLSTNLLVYTYLPTLGDDGKYFYDLNYTDTNALNYVKSGVYSVDFVLEDINGKIDTQSLENVNITSNCNPLENLIRTGGEKIINYLVIISFISMIGLSASLLYPLKRS